MSPGLKTEYSVVMTRTQPVDSCMMMAKITRASTPVVEAMAWMAVFMSATSASVSSGTLHCAQEAFMLAVLAVNLGVRVSEPACWCVGE